MNRRYDYTLKEISNGWLLTVDDNCLEKNSIYSQFFGYRIDALEYLIKLLGDMVDETPRQ